MSTHHSQCCFLSLTLSRKVMMTYLYCIVARRSYESAHIEGGIHHRKRLARSTINVEHNDTIIVLYHTDDDIYYKGTDF